MKFKGEYKYTDDFDIKYANGILGHVTGMGGDIVINFYFESPQYPNKFTLNEIDHDGNLNEVFEKNDDIDISRQVFSGVVMNLDTAKSLYEWLGKNIDIAESKRKGD